MGERKRVERFEDLIGSVARVIGGRGMEPCLIYGENSELVAKPSEDSCCRGSESPTALSPAERRPRP